MKKFSRVLKKSVPGIHDTEKFKMVGVWIDQEFLAQIDAARGEQGRSQFLRDALQEKLESEGISVMREKVVAPDRAGKGGPVSYLKVKRTKKLKEPS